jgi:hypothetical protein
MKNKSNKGKLLDLLRSFFHQIYCVLAVSSITSIFVNDEHEIYHKK